MPTRKQRRRQEKLRRHEYEEVYVDAEGNVVEPDEVEEEPAPSRNGRSPRQAKPRPAARQRATRTVPPPSLRRVLKRGAIFAPVMFIVVSLLAPDGVGIPSQVVQTLSLVAIFLPFSYLMDVVAYRVSLRRSGAGAGRPARRR